MIFVHRVLVVCVILLAYHDCCSYRYRGNHGCLANPLGTYRPNLTSLQFLEHVMTNDDRWSMVLNEWVRGLGPSPYSDRFDDAIVQPKYANLDMEVNTRYVLTEVMYRYSTIKSFVNYAAKAVHLAFTCFSVKHLAFQTYYVSRLIDMAVEPGRVLAEVTAVKEIAAVIIKMVAVLPADLNVIVKSYWELVRLMQYDVVHRVKYSVYPPESGRSAREMYERLMDYAKVNCATPVFNKQFFERIGIKVGQVVLDSVLGLDTDPETLMRLANDHLSFLVHFYDRLGVKSMSSKQWEHLFYYAKEPRTKREPDETSGKITDRTLMDQYVEAMTT